MSTDKIETDLVSVSLTALDRLAGSVRDMVTFTPGGENAVKAWYEYWEVLRRSHGQASEQIDGERRKARAKLTTFEKALGYARKFAAMETGAAAGNPAEAPDGSGTGGAVPPPAKFRDSPGALQMAVPGKDLGPDESQVILSEEVERRICGAEESIIRPILSRLDEVPSLIGSLVRSINAESVPELILNSRRLAMDGTGRFCFVTTMEKSDPLQAVRLCFALTGRIPWQYDFFTDDIGSFESPDGLVWFYPEVSAGALEYTQSVEAYKSVAEPPGGRITPARSHIPIVPPDGGPAYRLVNSGGFATVEYHRGDHFDSRLGDEEFSRITGYLVYLDSKGIIDFRISQS